MCVFLSVSPVSWFVEETADAEFNQVYDILIHKTPQAELCTGVMLHTVFFVFVWFTLLTSALVAVATNIWDNSIIGYWLFIIHKNLHTDERITLSVAWPLIQFMSPNQYICSV